MDGNRLLHLHTGGDDHSPCVIVRHRVRASALRIEAHVIGAVSLEAPR